MVWGSVTVGGVELRETITAEDVAGSFGGLRITGQESHPPQTTAAVIAAHHNIMACRGLTVPVVFTDKASLSGFYRITEAASSLLRHANGAVQTATWSMAMQKVGGSRDVEVESRVPTIGRQTDHAVTPVYWHAPAGGVSSYYTGPTVPATYVDRVSEDGTIRAHLGIPTDVAPRWTIPADEYLVGSARLLFDGIRRIGLHTPDLSVWELTNGLVRVVSYQQGLSVSCWSGGAWSSPKLVTFGINSVDYNAELPKPDLTIIRNDPEEVIIRLGYEMTDAGRVTVDLSLRRGARVVTGWLKRHSSASLSVTSFVNEPFGVVTGGIRQTTADASGNRWVIGSSKTVFTDPGWPFISRTGTELDFFVGHEVGDPAASGDAYADLLAQYLGGTGELARVVRR